MCADISRSSRFRPGYSRYVYNHRVAQNVPSPSPSDPTIKRKKYRSECERKVRTVYRGGGGGGGHSDHVDDLCGRVRRNLYVKRSTVSETAQNGSGDLEYYVGDDFVLEEPFSDSGDDTFVPKGTHLSLPLPRRRIRTLSGMIPPIGYSPTWGGPTMCLQCLEFFDVSKATESYVAHLLQKHKIVISDIKLIVDLKR
ncbi:unnamed protein product [Soboliphyme baturini]|uniref:Zf-C2H2_2 domain-containing protein n=1 Tax=Soboliphyme baturini TaxID=241478 RepID=A0A183J4U2_9BILA|nr:unnamed protein product [Soboliphyme baturini]